MKNKRALFIGPPGPATVFVEMLMQLLGAYGLKFDLITISELVKTDFNNRPSSEDIIALSDKTRGTPFDLVIIPDRSGDGAYWAHAMHRASRPCIVVYWTSVRIKEQDYPEWVTYFVVGDDMKGVILEHFTE